MSDRELLELAAKAAGITVESWTTYGAYVGGLEGCIWNPLTNDGDALRLACKLEFQVLIVGEGMCEVKCPEQHLAPIWEHVSGSDTALATRRAIVRAAAEVGKAMPPAPTSDQPVADPLRKGR